MARVDRRQVSRDYIRVEEALEQVSISLFCGNYIS